ncbi:hypothetical protein [Amnibacterium sp.]|uniref:hypothetical protein n=1 Tax=Amnibacterium sp. TaxID=1872496 RepID=UPI0026079469|nr:hypothetical protein [Amnibacterium sp.]MCU1474889.1 hypothetical protein [Amnibacterium sp.]
MTEQDVDALAAALTEDGDLDVSADGDDLLVHGRRFARVTDQGLIVDLPARRSADLLDRGIAAPGPADERATGAWVVVADRENWHELASEARDFVGEPPIGRQS